jgi:putative aldouronate transport system permease protein
MPHFLSWIIISGLALQLLAPTNGLVNILLNFIGIDSIPFLNDPSHWIWTYIFLGVWQSIGWNTIIYLAAITGINPELYEAASVDGANRFKKMWHITLPGIRPTIVVLLIMSLGRILGSEFDRPYALGNNLVKGVSNVISTFVYTNGVRGLQFSLTTAVGLFQSVICVIFLLAANAIAKKSGERGIW